MDLFNLGFIFFFMQHTMSHCYQAVGYRLAIVKTHYSMFCRE
jgi:hypothetical protein